MPQKLITYGFWFYEELLPLLKNASFRKLETPRGKFLTKVNSTRLRTFKQSPECATCHRVGSIWILQSNGPLSKKNAFRPHLNLYAVDNDKLVLMTQDHILPKSYGGTCHKDNLQTMCTDCNNTKGNTIPHGYTACNRHPAPMDGRGTRGRRLSEVRLHALAVLDALEATYQLNQNAGPNLQFQPECRNSLGVDPAVSWP